MEENSTVIMPNDDSTLTTQAELYEITQPKRTSTTSTTTKGYYKSRVSLLMETLQSTTTPTQDDNRIHSNHEQTTPSELKARGFFSNIPSEIIFI